MLPIDTIPAASYNIQKEGEKLAMGARRYIILKVFPPDGGNVKEFRMSKRTLRFCVGAVILFTVLAGSALYWTFKAGSEKLKYAELKRENIKLKEELQAIQQQVSALKDTIENLHRLGAVLSTMVGLESPPPEFRAMGIGGSLETPKDPIEKNLFDIKLDIDKLLGISEYEKKSFEEIQKKLLAKRRKLEHTPSIMPTSGYLSSGFGYRRDPFTGRIKFHRGIDLCAPVGTPVIAPAAGIVRKVGRDRGFGLYLIIDHGYGIHTYYAHLHKVAVRPGRRVKRGQIIAYVGNSGRSTGPHLHYEVRVNGRPVNPFKFIIPSETYYD